MTKKLPSDFSMEYGTDERVSIGCNYDGARYHIWLDAKTLQPASLWGSEGIIYKNPPIGVEYKGTGYFDTRKLRQDGAIGRILVPAMLARAHHLFGEMKKRHEDEQRSAESDRARDEAHQRVRDAAEDLLAACKSASESLELLRKDMPDGLAKSTALGYFYKVGPMLLAAIRKAEVKP